MEKMKLNKAISHRKNDEFHQEPRCIGRKDRQEMTVNESIELHKGMRNIKNDKYKKIFLCFK